MPMAHDCFSPPWHVIVSQKQLSHAIDQNGCATLTADEHQSATLSDELVIPLLGKEFITVVNEWGLLCFTCSATTSNCTGSSFVAVIVQQGKAFQTFWCMLRLLLLQCLSGKRWCRALQLFASDGINSQHQGYSGTLPLRFDYPANDEQYWFYRAHDDVWHHNVFWSCGEHRLWQEHFQWFSRKLQLVKVTILGRSASAVPPLVCAIARLWWIRRAS